MFFDFNAGVRFWWRLYEAGRRIIWSIREIAFSSNTWTLSVCYCIKYTLESWCLKNELWVKTHRIARRLRLVIRFFPYFFINRTRTKFIAGNFPIRFTPLRSSDERFFLSSKPSRKTFTRYSIKWNSQRDSRRQLECRNFYCRKLGRLCAWKYISLQFFWLKRILLLSNW